MSECKYTKRSMSLRFLIAIARKLVGSVNIEDDSQVMTHTEIKRLDQVYELTMKTRANTSRMLEVCYNFELYERKNWRILGDPK